MVRSSIAVIAGLSILLAAHATAAESVQLELLMPSHVYSPGMPCGLEAVIQNEGPAVPDAQLFVALTVGTGDYWFHPSWCLYPDQLDWEELSIGELEKSRTALIHEFPWPEDAGQFEGACFLGAVLSGGELISNLAEHTFEWGETPVDEQLVRVPAGTFQMGAPEEELCREEDEILFAVTLTRPFLLQRTEVSQRQWLQVFSTNPSHFVDPCRPVENVTWFDACIFCNRRSLAEGLTPCYYQDAEFLQVLDGTPPVTAGTVYWDRSAGGYRLPSEAEWEYACRAGTTTAYYSGETSTDCIRDSNLDPLAWYKATSNTGNGRESHVIASKLPNAWGLYNMQGNLGEWCWDWLGDYPVGSATDPVGPSMGQERINRGGAFNYRAAYCRSGNRWYDEPDAATNYYGFRLARSEP